MEEIMEATRGEDSGDLGFWAAVVGHKSTESSDDPYGKMFWGVYPPDIQADALRGYGKQ